MERVCDAATDIMAHAGPVGPGTASAGATLAADTTVAASPSFSSGAASLACATGRPRGGYWLVSPRQPDLRLIWDDLSQTS